MGVYHIHFTWLVLWICGEIVLAASLSCDVDPHNVFLSPADFDANNIFKAFFGGGGGQGYSFEANQCMYPNSCRKQYLKNNNNDDKFTILLNNLHFCFVASGPGNFFFQFG